MGAPTPPRASLELPTTSRFRVTPSRAHLVGHKALTDPGSAG